MPRRDPRSKPLIYRDMCLALDVVDLAAAGFLAPGHHAGDAELLVMVETSWRPTVSIRTLIGAKEGSLHLSTPHEETIPLQRLEGGPAGRSWWRMICKPCGRPVRRLFLPETPPGIPTPWACRLCWRIAYRDHRPERDGRETLAKFLALEAEVRRLKPVFMMGLIEPPDPGKPPRKSDT
jgi:hypothetical protein